MKVECLKEISLSFEVDSLLYFASDLHLGDGSDANDSKGHRAAFEWFLEHEVEADRGELTLLGDIFELWQCDLKSIREHYDGLFWRLHNYRLIRGNHDSAYRKPPEWYWPNRVQPVLLAEHGHRADIWNWRLGFVGHGLTIAAGLLERLGLTWIDDYRWRHLPTPVTHPNRFKPDLYAKYARRRARKTGARIVVLGHTHAPSLNRLEDGTIHADCGCWVSHDFLGSFVKVHDGKVSLWKVISP